MVDNKRAYEFYRSFGLSQVGPVFEVKKGNETAKVLSMEASFDEWTKQGHASDNH